MARSDLERKILACPKLRHLFSRYGHSRLDCKRPYGAFKGGIYDKLDMEHRKWEWAHKAHPKASKSMPSRYKRFYNSMKARWADRRRGRDYDD
jgi:hypothetical protein